MGKFIIVIIALMGAGLFAYPHVAAYLSDRNGSYAVREYDEAVAEREQAELDAAWDEAVVYNENLSGYPAHDPFLDGSGMVMPDNYYDVLNVDGVMGYVTIPRIDVELPIRHGTSARVLSEGAGHLEGSSLPVGGPSSHCVITGHTGLVSARLFTDLTGLDYGDVFYLHVLGRTLCYTVDRITVTEPDDTRELMRIKDGDYCTLLTCTPYGVNSHRLLVRGVRTPYSEDGGDGRGKGATLPVDRIILIAGACAVALIMVRLIIAAAGRRKRER